MVLSILCNKCGSEEDKILKEQESIETLKILGLITLKIWVKKISKISLTLDFFKKIDETRNFLFEEIKYD